MQPPARFRPQQYNSPDLVQRPNTAEPTSRALSFVSPCNVQRRSTKSADPALRYYDPYCFNQLAAGRKCSVTREISVIEISVPVPQKVEKMWRGEIDGDTTSQTDLGKCVKPRPSSSGVTKARSEFLCQP
ncbi:uncharacterized protein EAF01_008571 [Botrytis porri]|uniref:uncharacterized protein n=1 Tax=Botrytis porri TaxID=87229 RepID=UPI0018FF5919|nr:uncharacterized protein EAF01_008571 [Botrytis porri]KAF7899358.1 hypothetical protein EAF01_008571 [Botrytis porri]